MSKLIILGLAPTNEIINYENEIWGVNEAYSIYKCNKIFEMHKREYSNKYINRYTRNSYIEELKHLNIPIYMQNRYKDINTSIKYPIEELINYFSHMHQNKLLFRSSIDYMLALAIYKGYKEIDVIGVDMATITEYRKQRQSLLMWYGIALSKKINIQIKSKLFWREEDKELYGYDT